MDKKPPDMPAVLPTKWHRCTRTNAPSAMDKKPPSELARLWVPSTSVKLTCTLAAATLPPTRARLESSTTRRMLTDRDPPQNRTEPKKHHHHHQPAEARRHRGNRRVQRRVGSEGRVGDRGCAGTHNRE